MTRKTVAYYLVRKLKTILAKKTVNRKEEPDLEVEKRLNTLMEIVKKSVALIIWAVFIMIFLKKINTVSNMTKDWSAMVFDIGVTYKEDLNQVMKLMKQVADGMMKEDEYKDNILEPMEIFGLDSFGDNALVVKGRIKTRPIQQWTIGREYRKRLKEIFDEHRIEIPFPHQTIYWGEETDPLKLTLEKADGTAKKLK